tara:strand:+ start:317 stop:484 length:168 start_codon:yes stop_codon:yes gene_type:complete
MKSLFVVKVGGCQVAYAYELEGAKKIAEQFIGYEIFRIDVDYQGVMAPGILIERA